MTGDTGNPPGFGYPFVRTQNLVTTPKTPRHHRTRIIRRSRAVLPFITNLRRKDNSSPIPSLLSSDIADIVWHERRHWRIAGTFGDGYTILLFPLEQNVTL